MNAAWQRGVRDLLDWVLCERPDAPLTARIVDMPTVNDLSYEEVAASDVIAQGRPGGPRVNPATYSPPQYGEAIQATASWLRGQSTSRPVNQAGHGRYQAMAQE